MTLRLASLLAISACAAAPHPTPPPTIAYELPQWETSGCDMFCGFHNPLTTTRTWGSLELRGDVATLAIQSDSITPVVICPSVGPRDPMVSCVNADDARARQRPSHGEVVLQGRATRHGSRLDITVVHGDSHVELACGDTGTRLDCQATSTGPFSHLPAHVTLEQPAVANAPAMAAALDQHVDNPVGPR